MEKQFICWQIDEEPVRIKYLRLFSRNAVSELSLFSRVFGAKSPSVPPVSAITLRRPNSRKYFFVFIFLGVTAFCYSQNRYYVQPGVQKVFFGFNVLYDYEKLTTEDDFTIESNNMLFETTLGYDFGGIIPRIFLDIGLPLSGVAGFTDGNADIIKTMDTKNLKLGLEFGIKLIRTQKFDLIIPLGVLFCWTTYELKNPSYASGQPYDRIWDYNYTNLFSGINAAFKLNNHLKLGIFSRIEFSVKKEAEYQETLRGNYIWLSTNSSTRSIKSYIDVLNFAAGIGILANL
jgi:hypothetical protein